LCGLHPNYRMAEECSSPQKEREVPSSRLLIDLGKRLRISSIELFHPC
jgi:hypothetical protein